MDNDFIKIKNCLINLVKCFEEELSIDRNDSEVKTHVDTEKDKKTIEKREELTQRKRKKIIKLLEKIENISFDNEQRGDEESIIFGNDFEKGSERQGVQDDSDDEKDEPNSNAQESNSNTHTQDRNSSFGTNNLEIINKYISKWKKDYYSCINDLLSFIETECYEGNFDTQKKALIEIFIILKKMGLLDDLIAEENNIIDTTNEVLENQITPITEESLFSYIESLDANNPEDRNYILAANRHFLNRLGHNCEAVACVPIYFGVRGKDDFDIQIEEEAKRILNQFKIIRDNENDTDTNKINSFCALYKRYMQNPSQRIINNKFQTLLNKPDDESVLMVIKADLKRTIQTESRAYGKYLSGEKEYNEAKYDYSIELFKKVKRIFDEYKKECVINNTTEMNFSEIIKQLLDNQIDSEKIQQYPSLNAMMDIINSNVTRLCFINPKEMIQNLAIDIELEDKFMKAKHYSTQLLLGKYFSDNSGIYMEQEHSEENVGATYSYIDGALQIWSVHHKENEALETDGRLGVLMESKSDIREGFVDDQSATFKIKIPIPKVTSEQKEEFKQLLKYIRTIEGISKEGEDVKVEELSEKEKEKYKLLQDEYEKGTKKYVFLRTKILLGAGLNQFKEYYGIDDKGIIEQYQLGQDQKRIEEIRRQQEHETIRYFHDQKTDSFFEEEAGIDSLAQYSSYVKVMREKQKNQRQQEKRTEEDDVRYE